MALYMCGAELPPNHYMGFSLFGPIKIRESTPEEREVEERFQSLLESLKNIRDDDEWWFWKRVGSLETFYKRKGWHKVSKRRVALSLKALRKIFDNRWCREYCRRSKQKIPRDPLSHFAAQDTFFRIVRLGECILILEEEIFSKKELIARLKNSTTFHKALVELEIATCFKQEGIFQKIYPKVTSTRMPDGVVLIDNIKIYYEVTEQSWSGLYRNGLRAEDELVKWINKKLGVVNGHILFFRGKEDPIQSAKKAIEIMSAKLLNNSFPLKCKTEFFDAFFNKSPYDGGWIGIRGLEPDTIPLFLGGRKEVSASHEALAKEFRQCVHTRICGIIFAAKHLEGSGFLKHVPHVVINPRAKNRGDDGIFIMAKALFDYPDWI